MKTSIDIDDKPWYYFTNQKQWKWYLQDLVTRNNKAAKRAILAVYKNQTDEERHKHISLETNKKGFDSLDASFMSGIAEDLINGKELDAKDFAIARNKIKKYWKQLMVKSKENMKHECMQRPNYEDEEPYEYEDGQYILM